MSFSYKFLFCRFFLPALCFACNSLIGNKIRFTDTDWDMWTCFHGLLFPQSGELETGSRRFVRPSLTQDSLKEDRMRANQLEANRTRLLLETVMPGWPDKPVRILLPKPPALEQGTGPYSLLYLDMTAIISLLSYSTYDNILT